MKKMIVFTLILVVLFSSFVFAQPDLEIAESLVWVKDMYDDYENRGPCEGYFLMINYTLVNNGEIDADDFFQVEFYVDDVLVKTTNGNLLSSQEKTFTVAFVNLFSYFGDFYIGEGEHTITLKIDTDDDIIESNENNNIEEITFVADVDTECPEISCTDSDGGLAYFDKGMTYGTDASGNYYEVYDYCGDSYLVEYFCDQQNWKDEQSHSCYCEDGVCVEQYRDYEGGDNCPEFYTCPDGTQVEWCTWHVSESPDGQTGGAGCGCEQYPEKQCPDYTEPEINTPECPKYYTCPDGTQVLECNLISGETNCDGDGCSGGGGCGCISNPEDLCLDEEKGECPVSCDCTGDEIVCENIDNDDDLECSSGCVLGNKCIASGTRVKLDNVDSYCNLDGIWLYQKYVGEDCQNNHECTTNFCSEGKCYDIVGDLDETKGLVQQLMDMISNLFASIFGSN